MVELRLESVDESSTVSKDVYVSVRMGETQKLSKLSNTRVYRFPDGVDQRLGKIEVFQRLGQCSVDVDPENKRTREVNIACGKESLALRVHLENVAATKQQIAEDTMTKKELKMKSAKEYLSKHGLEVRLSEAMSSVLRDRPEDPAAFIAELLTKGKVTAPAPAPVESQKAVPPPKPASPPAAPAIVPFGPYYAANFRSVGSMDSTYAKFPQMKKPASAQPSKPSDAPSAKVAAPGIAPFGPYYAANFRSVGNMESTYAKFPQVKKPASAEPSKPNDVQSAKVAARYEAPKAAAEPTKVAAPGIAPFGPYYAANFRSVGSMDSTYAKFPEAKKPSKVEHSKPDDAQPKQASSGIPVQLKPSVGTWFMRPVKFNSGTEAAKATVAAEAVVQQAKPNDAQPVQATDIVPVQLKPSVGTWYMRPVGFKPAFKTTHTAPVTAPATVAAAAAPSSVPVQSSPTTATPAAVVPASTTPTKGFAFQPSVGSWLAVRLKTAAAKPAQETPPASTAAEAAKPTFSLRPSVGTWLVPMSKPVPMCIVSRRFRDLNPAATMTSDERYEVERVMTKALATLTGKLEGEYFPLTSSSSYPPLPGGMTACESAALSQAGLLFDAPSACGRGVFVMKDRQAAVWVNTLDQHVTFIIMPGSSIKVRSLEQAVYDALKQDGHHLV